MPDLPNPWLEIPAADYEGHMGSPEVGQLQLLNQLLARAVAATRPECAAVLGVAAGNGLEHFDPTVTQRILGVDLNPAYLELARRRFPALAGRLELLCADLDAWDPAPSQFDLVSAALIFEYVNAARLLRQIRRALTPTGVLAVVLQLPSPGLPSVSKTRYASLEKLAPLFRHYTRAEFLALASAAGLVEQAGEVIPLPSGKEFYFGSFVLPQR